MRLKFCAIRSNYLVFIDPWQKLSELLSSKMWRMYLKTKECRLALNYCNSRYSNILKRWNVYFSVHSSSQNSNFLTHLHGGNSTVLPYFFVAAIRLGNIEFGKSENFSRSEKTRNQAFQFEKYYGKPVTG